MFVNVKGFIPAVVLFAINSLLPVVFAQESSSSLNNYFYNKCRVNSPNTPAYDTLIGNFNEYILSLENSFAYLPNDKESFCKIERPRLIQRTKSLTKDLKPCLPKEEDFLPKFVEDTFDEFLHFLCHNHGENIHKFFSKRGKECREAIDVDKSISLDFCFGKIFIPLQNYVKKEELCEAETVAKKCFMSVLNQKCPTYDGYKELNEQFFQYIKKPCSGCALTSINNLLILITVYFALYRLF